MIHGGTDGNNFLFAGNGPATLFGGGAGDQLFAYGDVSQALIASNGNTPLDGSFGSGRNTFQSGRGDDSVVGGTGRDLFVGGGGVDTVFATDGGRDMFRFINGQAGGVTLVQNIYEESDVRIDLVDYGCGAARSALDHQTTDGSSVSISLSDGTRITFENITYLTDRNFT